jgi:hypothetical protein
LSRFGARAVHVSNYLLLFANHRVDRLVVAVGQLLAQLERQLAQQVLGLIESCLLLVMVDRRRRCHSTRS